MEAEMDRATFLDTLLTWRARWEELLSRVGEARMEEPGVEGDWSVKDIVAHITWYEREMVGLLRGTLSGESDATWELPLDERNAAIAEQERLASPYELQ